MISTDLRGFLKQVVRFEIDIGIKSLNNPSSYQIFQVLEQKIIYFTKPWKQYNILHEINLKCLSIISMPENI